MTRAGPSSSTQRPFSTQPIWAAAGTTTAIAVDAIGDAYVTGGTVSTDFPTTPAAYDTIFHGADSDAFVTKLNPAGSALLYSTYLGGFTAPATSCCTQWGDNIAVDTTGSAYV